MKTGHALQKTMHVLLSALVLVAVGSAYAKYIGWTHRWHNKTPFEAEVTGIFGGCEKKFFTLDSNQTKKKKVHACMAKEYKVELFKLTEKTGKDAYGYKKVKVGEAHWKGLFSGTADWTITMDPTGKHFYINKH